MLMLWSGLGKETWPCCALVFVSLLNSPNRGTRYSQCLGLQYLGYTAFLIFAAVVMTHDQLVDLNMNTFFNAGLR